VAFSEMMNNMKQVLMRLLEFVLFAILAQGLCYISHIDILNDLTIFNHFPLVIFLLAAAGLSLVLDIVQIFIHVSVYKYIPDITVLVILFGAALLYPRRSNGDGIAVGIISFLIGYWVVLIGLFRLGTGMINRRTKKGVEPSNSG
jgi:hypothetical protein